MGWNLQNATQLERDADRERLGVQFLEFDKVFEANVSGADFVLITNNEKVKKAYAKMTKHENTKNNF